MPMLTLPDVVAATIYVLFLGMYVVALFKVDEWLAYSPH